MNILKYKNVKLLLIGIGYEIQVIIGYQLKKIHIVCPYNQSCLKSLFS